MTLQRHVAAVAVVLTGLSLSASPAASQYPHRERTFLLVEAPERAQPNESATLTIRLKPGLEPMPPRVEVALYRFHQPEDALPLVGERAGVAVAQSALGAELEHLANLRVPFPRRGHQVDLLRVSRVAIAPPGRPRRTLDEQPLYDSYEDDEADAQTYWMASERWAEETVRLGPLPEGSYLARVHAGPFAATAILSVGRLVLVARRGDQEDLLWVTNPNGRPQPGVTVRALVNGVEVDEGATNAEGTFRTSARPESTVRFVAARGDDLAFADVRRATLGPCEPLVYLATGRPVYRPGEQLFLRGHVRGCDEGGRLGPLDGARLEVRAGGDPVAVTTDSRGNFTQALSVTGSEIVATLDGREHRRDLQLDTRRLPRRPLHVRLSHGWATPGSLVTVQVADDEGGWPQERAVVLRTPGGRFRVPIGPGSPATAAFRVPDLSGPEGLRVQAELGDGGTVVSAEASLWGVPTSRLLRVIVPGRVAPAASGAPITAALALRDPAGAALEGPVTVRVFATDSAGAKGRLLASEETQVTGGRAELPLFLDGSGPWLVVGESGDARDEAIVWARARPPTLGRGEVGLQPASPHVAPGAPIAVALRLTDGSGWLTLEQGSAWWAEHYARPGSFEVTVPGLDAPERALGLVSLVLTQVSGGQVETVTAAVDVAPSPMTLTVALDRTLVREGETVRAELTARDAAGQPLAGRASIWVADDGYWALGQETYPDVDRFFARPSRPASHGDSTRVDAFGAEEGRLLPDAELTWNGRRLSGTSYRHAWGYFGRVIDVDLRGSLRELWQRVARAGGLRGAEVCPRFVEAAGPLQVTIHDLPWDLAAQRIAEELDALSDVQRGVLRMPCDQDSVTGGSGFGTLGGGGSGAGYGTGAAGSSREQRLEGTVLFLGDVELDAAGKASVDLPLPSVPGRWRIEALAIGESGSGSGAHASVQTTRPVLARLSLPRNLRPGDRVRAEVEVEAQGTDASLSWTFPAGLRVEGAPTRLRLNGGIGRATFEVVVEDDATGPAIIELSAASGAGRDDVRTNITVRRGLRRPVAQLYTLGAAATDIDLSLEHVLGGASLRIERDATPVDEIERAFERLRTPRWRVASLRIDRLEGLATLLEAASPLVSPELTEDIRRAYRSEIAALLEHEGDDGQYRWYRGARPDPQTAAALLIALRHEPRDRFEGPRRFLRRQAPTMPLRLAALAAHALAREEGADREAAKVLLRRAASHPAPSLAHLTHALEASGLLEEPTDALATDLAAALEDQQLPVRVCRGPHWFLCSQGRGDRAQLAMAARALSNANHPRAPAIAEGVIATLARDPRPTGWPLWGTSEPVELALLAPRLTRAPRPVVTIDGRRAATVGSAVVVPAGARNVRLSFPAAEGRLSRIRVEGEIPIREPSRSVGALPFRRAFIHRGGQWALELDVTLPAEEDRLRLEVPMPAGLSPVSVTRVREATGAALVELRAGTLVLEWTAAAGGRHQWSVTLEQTTAGQVSAGPAIARHGDDWKLLPSLRLELPGN